MANLQTVVIDLKKLQTDAGQCHSKNSKESVTAVRQHFLGVPVALDWRGSGFTLGQDVPGISLQLLQVVRDSLKVPPRTWSHGHNYHGHNYHGHNYRAALACECHVAWVVVAAAVQ